MVIEAVALKKNSYFVDPKNGSQTFFKDLNYLNILKINNKKKLDNYIANHHKLKKIINNTKTKIYCYPHKNTTKRLVRFLS